MRCVYRSYSFNLEMELVLIQNMQEGRGEGEDKRLESGFHAGDEPAQGEGIASKTAVLAPVL